MHEITGNLFESVKADAICITTNGFINATGANTMGRGSAGEAKRRWPGIEMLIGQHLEHGGNDCRLLTQTYYDKFFLPAAHMYPAQETPYHILMFPTKVDNVSFGDLLATYRTPTRSMAAINSSAVFPGWMGKSSLGLIQRSAEQLAELTDRHGWSSVILPRAGSGAGELSWEHEVRPLLGKILDARFYAITFPAKR
jgi:hypothetical protein